MVQRVSMQMSQQVFWVCFCHPWCCRLHGTISAGGEGTEIQTRLLEAGAVEGQRHLDCRQQGRTVALLNIAIAHLFPQQVATGQPLVGSTCLYVYRVPRGRGDLGLGVWCLPRNDSPPVRRCDVATKQREFVTAQSTPTAQCSVLCDQRQD